METASTRSWKDDLNRSNVRSAIMIGKPNSSTNVVRRKSLHVLEGQSHSPYHTVQALYQITVYYWHFFHITATSHTPLKFPNTISHGSNQCFTDWNQDPAVVVSHTDTSQRPLKYADGGIITNDLWFAWNQHLSSSNSFGKFQRLFYLHHQGLL